MGVVVHLGIKTYLNHNYQDVCHHTYRCHKLLKEYNCTMAEASFSSLLGAAFCLSPLNLEESRLLSHAKILIQPQNSLAQEQPQSELLDQELVSAQYLAPLLLVMQETHRLNNNFSHTLF